jgi:multidrug efflux pump subunit AcrA (membrane-fusion protein)
MTVPTGNVSIILNQSGTVVNTGDVPVFPALYESITNVYVKPGDVVQKGEILATLKDFKERSNLAAAYIQLLGARAKFSSEIPEPSEQVRATLAAAQAEYDFHQDQLNASKILSPINGVIASVTGTVGQFPMNLSVPMFVISSNLPAQFQTTLNRTDGSRLKVGQRVSVIFNIPQPQVEQLANVRPTKSSSEKPVPPSLTPLIPTTFNGVIDSLIPVPASKDVSPGIQVNVSFTSKTSSIYPGLSGNLQTAVIAATNTVIVPNGAIYPYGGLYRVNVVTYDHGKKISTPTTVTLGVVGDTSTQVLRGLSAGQKIEVKYK